MREVKPQFRYQLGYQLYHSQFYPQLSVQFRYSEINISLRSQLRKALP
jgi:hypothetical protein